MSSQRAQAEADDTGWCPWYGAGAAPVPPADLTDPGDPQTHCGMPTEQGWGQSCARNVPVGCQQSRDGGSPVPGTCLWDAKIAEIGAELCQELASYHSHPAPPSAAAEDKILLSYNKEERELPYCNPCKTRVTHGVTNC